MDEICFIAQQSNASIIGTNESKLNSSILNSEVSNKGYGVNRIDCSRRGGGVACYIRKSLSYNHKSSFCVNTDSIFVYIFSSKSKPILEVFHLTNPDL